MKINFDNLESYLQTRTLIYLTQWLPGGKLIGQEYTCGSIRGNEGSSFKYNIQNNKWKDFAENDVKGTGLISLYASIHGVGYADAAFKLNDELNFTPTKVIENKKTETKTYSFSPAPLSSPRPSMYHSRFGSPADYWEYRNENGEIVFYMARYNHKTGKKDFIPWSYTSDGRWIPKAYQKDRVIYNLKLLHEVPDRHVIIVEGEKCAAAAMDLLGDIYIPVTWSGGAQAVSKTDFSPLYGRKILLWPDNDEPGISAMKKISHILFNHCEDIKFINPKDKPDGWDIADAKKEGITKSDLLAWARTCLTVIKPINTTELVERLDKTEKVKSIPAVIVDDGIEITNDVRKLVSVLNLTTEGADQKPICNVANVLAVLSFIPKYKDMVWFNEFKNQMYSNETDLWRESQELNILIEFQQSYGFYKLTNKVLADAIRQLAILNKRNPIKEKLLSLEWDKVPRVDSFFIDRYGVSDTLYSRKVSSSFYISLVARIMNPGCKVDTMVVLEGESGTGKSSFAEHILGEEYFTQANKDLSHKDFKQGLVGYAIVEFSELAQLSRADKEIVKAEITTRIDKFRWSHGRDNEEFKRTCVFIGTTNRDDYLNDETGNRRFLPLVVNRPEGKSLKDWYEENLEYIKSNRDQIMAEAVQRYNSGESWYDIPVDEMLHEQSIRYEVDPWESIIMDYMESVYEKYGRNSFTINEFFSDQCLNIPAEKRSIIDSRRIGRIMKFNDVKSTRGKYNDTRKTVTKYTFKDYKNVIDENITDLSCSAKELRNFAPKFDLSRETKTERDMSETENY